MSISKSMAMLVIIALVLGCNGPEKLVKVSDKYPICVELNWKYMGRSDIERAHDFEVTRINDSKYNGTIYVGDFPDFKKFSPDEKYYEPIGKVVFMGAESSDGIRRELHRFGLGKEPSIYVLLSFKSEKQLDSLIASKTFIGKVVHCK